MVMTEGVTENPKDGGLTDFDKEFLGDFYFSFNIGQNHYDYQYLALIYLARSYDPGQLGSPQQLSDRLAPRVAKMRMPHNHSKKRVFSPYDLMEFSTQEYISEQNEHNEFQRVWAAYLQIIGNTAFHQSLTMPLSDGKIVVKMTAMTDEELKAAITENLVAADTHYQTKPRHMIASNGDPHESFIKTYALDGHSTGSSRMDHLFIGVRNVIVSALQEPEPLVNRGSLRANLLMLNQRWQTEHPGQPSMFAGLND